MARNMLAGVFVRCFVFLAVNFLVGYDEGGW
jgi:hypothetical protein